jgi:hypothetical protein
VVHIAHPVPQHLPRQPHQIRLVGRIIGNIHVLTAIVFVEQKWREVSCELYKRKAGVPQDCQAGVAGGCAKVLLPDVGHLWIGKIQFGDTEIPPVFRNLARLQR